MNRRDFIRTTTLASSSLLLSPQNSYACVSDNEQVQLQSELIYKNPFSSHSDIDKFRLEGDAIIDFHDSKMRMENRYNRGEGKTPHFVLWCPEDFPDDIMITWRFKPIREPGLCVLFFAAKGRNGEDVFDPSLAERGGNYWLYHSGDINTYHLSYFRRMAPRERAFNIVNLRKSYGFNRVCRGSDPIPSVDNVMYSFPMKLVKIGSEISFYIKNLKVLHWIDDGITYGPLLGGGKIGFRQMAPLIGEYSNLEVYKLG